MLNREDLKIGAEAWVLAYRPEPDGENLFVTHDSLISIRRCLVISFDEDDVCVWGLYPRWWETDGLQSVTNPCMYSVDRHAFFHSIHLEYLDIFADKIAAEKQADLIKKELKENAKAK